MVSGPQMAQAVQAGGPQAQDWVQALLSVFCVDSVRLALQAAFDYLKQGPGGLTAVQTFFSQLVAAADDRGKPACASVAVTQAGGTPPTKYDFHTGKPVAGPTTVTTAPPGPEAIGPAGAPAPRPEGIQLFAAMNANATTATCPQFDPASLRWNVSSLAYDTSGSAASPDPSFSQQLAGQMCSNPSAAATRLVEAVKAGGNQAQAAAAAVKQVLQSGSCSMEPALLAVLNLVNPRLDQGSLDDTRSFLEAFARAADAQGLAVCGAYAVVDTAAQRITSQHVYHTGTSV
ncbi:hypothetical protein ABPG75_013681 [Micractinium tetrahymenae]